MLIAKLNRIKGVQVSDTTNDDKDYNSRQQKC